MTGKTAINSGSQPHLLVEGQDARNEALHWLPLLLPDLPCCQWAEAHAMALFAMACDPSIVPVTKAS